MKNVKILLFSFLCVLMSCANEDPVSYGNSDKESFKLKSKTSLTSEEVEGLREQLMIIAQTQEWAHKQAAVQYFVSNMKTDVVEFKDRQDLETWLTGGGLQKTSFNSVNDGLDAFDTMVAKVAVVMNANLSFYESLAIAKTDQLQIIFEPIRTPISAVPSVTPCQNTCIALFELDQLVAEELFDLAMIGIEQLDMGKYGTHVAVAIAEYTFYWRMEVCIENFNYCMGDCDYHS